MFSKGKPLPDGIFVVSEQLPGFYAVGDQTQRLQFGYWPSYNVPFYEQIYNLSGTSEKKKKKKKKRRRRRRRRRRTGGRRKKKTATMTRRKNKNKKNNKNENKNKKCK